MSSIVLVWLPVASIKFCELPRGNELRLQVGKHQWTDDRICIIVIDIWLSLIKSLHSLKTQMWFYKRNNFIYNFVAEKINLG